MFERSVQAEQAEVLQAALLSQLCETRKELGLAQCELADRIGVSRMTVQRSEQEGADPQLSTFLAMALALNRMPRLTALTPEESPALPQDLVHRGYAHNRTKHNLGDRDRQREAALAKSWEAVNEHQSFGLSAILPALIPDCSQDQASACATVIQWLGSEVGFDFLGRALAHAGYKLVDTK